MRVYIAGPMTDVVNNNRPAFARAWNELIRHGFDAISPHFLESAVEIDTRPFFEPLPSLPPYSSEERFPVAEQVARRGICLPTHVGLSERTIEDVCDQLLFAVEREEELCRPAVASL